MKQLTSEEAIKFSESESYKDMSYSEIADFQINQKFLCMPFEIFHESVEKTIGYPVFTHEFAINFECIKKQIMEKVKE